MQSLLHLANAAAALGPNGEEHGATAHLSPMSPVPSSSLASPSGRRSAAGRHSATNSPWLSSSSSARSSSPKTSAAKLPPPLKLPAAIKPLPSSPSMASQSLLPLPLPLPLTSSTLTKLPQLPSLPLTPGYKDANTSLPLPLPLPLPMPLPLPTSGSPPSQPINDPPSKSSDSATGFLPLPPPPLPLPLPLLPTSRRGAPSSGNSSVSSSPKHSLRDPAMPRSVSGDTSENESDASFRSSSNSPSNSHNHRRFHHFDVSSQISRRSRSPSNSGRRHHSHSPSRRHSPLNDSTRHHHPSSHSSDAFGLKARTSNGSEFTVTLRCSPYFSRYHDGRHDSYEHDANQDFPYMKDEYAKSERVREGASAASHDDDTDRQADDDQNGSYRHDIRSSLQYQRYARANSSSLSPRRLPSSIPSKLRCSRCAVRYNRSHHQTGDKKFDLNVQNLRMTCGECYCVFYSCSSCNMPFKEQCDGDRHLRVHTKEKPFSCDVCNARFTQKQSLTRHYKRHTAYRQQYPNGPPNMMEDGTILYPSNGPAMVSPAGGPHESSSQTGAFSSFASPDDGDSSDSAADVHSPSNFAFTTAAAATATASKLKGGGDLRCHFCDRVFGARSHLEQHIRTHTKEKPYGCPANMCNKQFTQKGHAMLHANVHGATPQSLLCPHCPRTFAQRVNLENHLRTHSKDRQFVCHMCNARFILNHHLKRHMRTVHENKRPYVCRTCGSRFALKQHLTRHSKRKHTGGGHGHGHGHGPPFHYHHHHAMAMRRGSADGLSVGSRDSSSSEFAHSHHLGEHGHSHAHASHRGDHRDYAASASPSPSSSVHSQRHALSLPPPLKYETSVRHDYHH